jgi:aminomethyltransferase
MCDASSRASLQTLYREHLALGARFGDDAVVTSYAHEEEGVVQEHGQAVLCDITHAQVLYFAGPDAPAFAHAAFAIEPLSVGACAFGAVLTGDGKVTSIPLLARTGSQEYIALDSTPRASVLDGWLSFLAHVSSDGYAPYAHMQAQDVTAKHVVLSLQGEAAPSVLGDYVGEQTLPIPGHVASVLLDRIPCIVLNVGTYETPSFVIMVPPNAAVVLWRSLLSFTEVAPVGTQTFVRMESRRHPWLARLCDTSDRLDFSREALVRDALIRGTDDFVGARALRSKKEGELQ